MLQTNAIPHIHHFKLRRRIFVNCFNQLFLGVHFQKFLLTFIGLEIVLCLIQYQRGRPREGAWFVEGLGAGPEGRKLARREKKKCTSQ